MWTGPAAAIADALAETDATLAVAALRSAPAAVAWAARATAAAVPMAAQESSGSTTISFL